MDMSYYTLSLLEQMQMINLADRFLEEFEKDKMPIHPEWEKGCSILNEAIITDVDQQIYRSNVEVFYQLPHSLEKKCSYLVSLVKFPEDSWRVLQVTSSLK